MNFSTQNADPAEIAKFTALAQSWWDPNGPSKLLHELNPLRLRYVDRAVALPARQILDVGCGGGILSESMARAGARVLGIDLAPALIEVAQLHALEARIAVDYRTVAAEDLAGLAHLVVPRDAAPNVLATPQNEKLDFFIARRRVGRRRRSTSDDYGTTHRTTSDSDRFRGG